MIFVTVGAQMAFDRLIRAVDQWAGLSGHGDVFAQTGMGGYQPLHLRHERFLEPARFRSVFREATLIVAHAGMGSIITALDLAKPILVMPRRGDLAETRNDHQIATARRFATLGAVHVAMDEKELAARLDELTNGTPARAASVEGCRLGNGACALRSGACFRVGSPAMPCPSLLSGIQAFISGAPVPAVLTLSMGDVAAGLVRSQQAAHPDPACVSQPDPMEKPLDLCDHSRP